MDCIPVSGRRGSLVSGRCSFISNGFTIESTTDLKEVLTQVHSSTDRDDIIPILDVDSFGKRYINPDVVKEVRVRGRRLWLITYIRSVDDIIDAMCGAFDRLCVPIHTLDHMDVLSEGLEISDCIVPTIFVRDGKHIGDGDKDDLISSMVHLGYQEYAIFDIERCTIDHLESSMAADI